MTAHHPLHPGPGRGSGSAHLDIDRPASRGGDQLDVATVDRRLRLAFAPLDKRAFGVAVGVTVGLTLFLVTAVRLLVDPAGITNLALLSQFLAGYRESWVGAAIGLAWGFAVGFVAGWFAAFLRNLVLATYLFIMRTRAELLATRDFLDHI